MQKKNCNSRYLNFYSDWMRVVTLTQTSKRKKKKTIQQKAIKTNDIDNVIMYNCNEELIRMEIFHLMCIDP